MVWLGYVAVFALGFGLGYAFLYYRNNDNRVRELENHLTALQGKYESYQQAVTGHFAQSAQLVNNLTTAYRDVHEHLQRGASDLCADNQRHSTNNPANAFIGLSAPQETFPHPAMLNDDKFLANVMPPRDYATKSPDDKGTLDEEFGLK
jgi:uncharacterized membrane-anchored protein YhcB (DUF1043 family)